MDIAASIQKVTEEIMIKLSKSIREIAIIIDVNMTNPIKFTKQFVEKT